MRFNLSTLALIRTLLHYSERQGAVRAAYFSVRFCIQVDDTLALTDLVEIPQYDRGWHVMKITILTAARSSEPEVVVTCKIVWAARVVTLRVSQLYSVSQ